MSLELKIIVRRGRSTAAKEETSEMGKRWNCRYAEHTTAAPTNLWQGKAMAKFRWFHGANGPSVAVQTDDLFAPPF